jgi:hypothetical protein
MRRRRWLALVLVAIAAAATTAVLWSRDPRSGPGTFERVGAVAAREEGIGPDGRPVDFVRSPKNDIFTNVIGPDGRIVRVRILAFVPRPTFWEWVRSWLGL